MTAEVAILNKQGVAMAADSAVTVGNQKIFNTVNKLFALSKYHPVGIMVYSSAEIMGVPVEAVVKAYRKQLGDEEYPTIKGYAENFREFLFTDKNIFSDSLRESGLCSSAQKVFINIDNEARYLIKRKYNKAWGCSKPQAIEAVNRVVVELEERVDKKDLLVNEKVYNKVQDITRDAIEHNLKALNDVFDIPTNLKERISKLAVDQLCKETELGGETGIVIAGYGGSEIFPSISSMEFQCSAHGLNNCPKKILVSINDSHRYNDAKIVPFAQGDVMRLFMEGRDRSYDSFIQNSLDIMFDNIIDKIVESSETEPELGEMLSSIKNVAIATLLEEINEFADMQFILPTMSTVASMPKEELARLAEALINLTSLKRRASWDTETVGGPTDVAVISKGDGFVWISRKHYFDPKLNPGFTAKYLDR